MRIGVDALTESHKPGPLAGKWCHLVCDDFTPEGLEQLHTFARKIGMRREWFQDPPGPPRPHYDLRPVKRKMALRFGALTLTRHELCDFLQLGRLSLAESGSDRWTLEQHRKYSSPYDSAITDALVEVEL